MLLWPASHVAISSCVTYFLPDTDGILNTVMTLSPCESHLYVVCDLHPEEDKPEVFPLLSEITNNPRIVHQPTSSISWGEFKIFKPDVIHKKLT